MKTLRLNEREPFGVIISSGARKYVEYALDGSKKVLIVSDETVFRLYGNSIKKMIKGVGAEAFTFILPAGENVKNKHVLDKLLILMTELNLNKSDHVIAFGGGSVAKLTGFSCSIFKGGIPYIYLPTTLLGMVNSHADAKNDIDFLGKKNLLSTINSPRAVFCDTDFLGTLPSGNLAEGYVEIIRRLTAIDVKNSLAMARENVEREDLIYQAIIAGQKLKNTNKSRFALPFASIAEKITGFSVANGKAVAFGIMAAADAAVTFGADASVEESFAGLLNKFDIKWDIGISTVELYNTLLKESEGLDKIPIIIPVKLGKCKVKKLTREKIKETFCGR